MPRERQSSPAGDRGASNAVDLDKPIVVPILPNVTDVIGHCHAVLVLTPAGRWTRRLYLSLHSADRAMERARSRGQVVHCIMVELHPVAGGPVTVVGGDQ